MAGQKYWAHGTQVTFNSVTIGGIESVEGPQESTDKVETTDTDSGGREESIPGLTRPGDFTITCRQIFGDAGQTELMDASANKTVAEVVVTAPPGATDDSTVATETFDGWVKDINRSKPAVANEPAMITFTLENTGVISTAVA